MSRPPARSKALGGMQDLLFRTLVVPGGKIETLYLSTLESGDPGGIS